MICETEDMEYEIEEQWHQLANNSLRLESSSWECNSKQLSTLACLKALSTYHCTTYMLSLWLESRFHTP